MFVSSLRVIIINSFISAMISLTHTLFHYSTNFTRIPWSFSFNIEISQKHITFESYALIKQTHSFSLKTFSLSLQFNSTINLFQGKTNRFH